MVGLFSRFSVSKNGHRRSQSAIDEREVLPPNSEITDIATVVEATPIAHHGIELAVEFKPIEQPIEPFDNDLPIQCPLPEPSILNDGRIWKERVCAGVGRRVELPEGTTGWVGPETPQTRSRQQANNRMILPSISAPEHNILKLLQESGM